MGGRILLAFSLTIWSLHLLLWGCGTISPEDSASQESQGGSAVTPENPDSSDSSSPDSPSDAGGGGDGGTQPTPSSTPVATPTSTPIATPTPPLNSSPTPTATPPHATPTPPPIIGGEEVSISLVPTTQYCVAPCAVWFDASGTLDSRGNETEARLGLDYYYQYGDSSSGSWSRGALARNGTAPSKNLDVSTGVVGFHVYEQPGTYTATLTVGGSSASTPITVLSPDAIWTGTDTVCVTTGTPSSASGCPAGAAIAQATGADSLSQAILTHCSGSKRCLFKRGETYSSSSPIVIPTGTKYFGAYGSGPKPIWQDTSTTPNNALIGFRDNLSDFRFVDLDVRGKVDVINNGSGVAFNASNNIVINRALWLRVDITRFDVALYMHCNNAPACDLDSGDVHNEIAFVDSKAQYGPGAQANLSNLANLYITAKYFAMAGSLNGDDLAGVNVGGISGSSFNGRFKYIDKGYIAHNEWGLLNPDQGDPYGVAAEVIGCGHELENNGIVGPRGGGILTLRNGLNMGTAGDFPSQDEIFVDNYLSACKYTQTAMLSVAATDCNMEKVEEWHRYTRVTGNLFSSEHSARLNSTVNMVLVGKTQGFLMSNNVLDGTEYTQNASSATALAINDCESQYGNANYRGSTDWKIFHNSFTVATSTTQGHNFWRGTADQGLPVTHATNLQFDNNLYFDGDGSGTLPGTFPGLTCCGGACPGSCNVKTSTNPWTGAWPFTSVDEYRFVDGSAAGIDAGIDRPEVQRDIFGMLRPAHGSDLGAVEYDYALPPAAMPLGMNLGRVTTTSPQIVFTDGVQPPFYPPFLDGLRGFQVIRFMDFLRTNHSRLVHWSERTTPTSPSQTGPYGAAYEYALDIANAVNADAWINVPHMADDDFVRALARLVLARLQSSHRVYFEYSNELWNGDFEQVAWVQAQGCADPSTFVPFSGSGTDWGIAGCNDTTAGRRFQVKRNAQIFSIIDQEFAGQTHRLVKVLGGVSASPGTSAELLTYFTSLAFNPGGVQLDALAIAPYFGRGYIVNDIINSGLSDTITVPEILALAEEDIAVTLATAQDNKLLADQYGLRLITYEGGQTLRMPGAEAVLDTLALKLIEANRQPRMCQLYLDYLSSWYATSSDLFMHFNYVSAYNQYGSWGTLESLDQLAAPPPKYEALMHALGGIFDPNVCH